MQWTISKLHNSHKTNFFNKNILSLTISLKVTFLDSKFTIRHQQDQKKIYHVKMAVAMGLSANCTYNQHTNWYRSIMTHHTQWEQTKRAKTKGYKYTD